jgi:hypothetical protein
MKKTILMIWFILNSNNLGADSFTLTGTIQPASIVSFIPITNNLISDTHQFVTPTQALEETVILGDYLTIFQNIYIKTNTNVTLGMSLEGITNEYGSLVSTVDARKTIAMNYYLNNVQFTPSLDPTEFKSLGVSTINNGNSPIDYKLKLVSDESIPTNKLAGEYRTTIKVTIAVL